MLRSLALCVGVVFLLGGCWDSANYIPVQPSAVQEGKGGSFTTYGKLEVWTSGAPQRPYRVVGMVADTRQINDWDPSPEVKADISHRLVQEARPYHPDALILISQEHPTENFEEYKPDPTNVSWTYTDRNGNTQLRNEPRVGVIYTGNTVQGLDQYWVTTTAQAIVYVR